MRPAPERDVRRKFAGVVQLSVPAAYTGGAIVMPAPLGAQRVEMPRARRTLIAFPGWTMHEVEPVTAGTRWSLCVNGCRSGGAVR